ncbi:MAG: TRAP transporter fused permease subunit [Methylibium sp.]|uniref:TRAP transporter permease n=1 Tax=Methylibium sp. TaxID=2067992 RepID=UPI001853AB44|nr:TRAP transporter fused permease subunit [Methylibium sp.]MBA3597044.1 TRAP transporter fused permease subunit [Methylibium sp.]
MDSSTRLLKTLESVYMIAALAAIAYHGLSVFWTFHGAMEHYTVHLGAILLLIALHIAVTKGQTTIGTNRIAWLVFACLMFILTLVSTAYLYIFAEALELSQPFITDFQYLIGFVLIFTVFALNWVVWGTALTIVCVLAALYFGLGHLIPSPVADLQFSPSVVMSYLAGMGGPRGVYSFIPLSADTIFLLLVYGGLMTSTRVLDMFEEIGKAIGNLVRGGVGYSCIVASSLVGMVSGQTVSCIALSGSMTIPTMIRGGYTREQAGAVEVMAANGSQIIPPVMGLGAFLMAVLLGISYVEVVAAALLPAFLYMFALALAVYSLIQASPKIPYERLTVDWKKVSWILPSFLPSIMLIVVLLSLRYSGGMAALAGSATLVGLSILRPKIYRPSFKGLLSGLANGALAGAQLAIILAAIGVVVQMLVTTGLGTLFAQLMIGVSGGSVGIALLLGMGIVLIIGMGLPTPAAYSLAAIVVIPSLIDVGVNPLAAHFFGFYFAVFSAFTPPVAVGVLMAVKISHGSFTKTCLESFKLGAICLLLPFFLVAFPNILEFPNLTTETLVAVFLFCISTLMLSAAIYGGFMGRLVTWERLYMTTGPVLTVMYFQWQDAWLAAIPVLLLIGFAIYKKSERRKAPQSVAV